MAVKRNENDRNARALKARKDKVIPGTFTTTDGTNRVIKLKDKPDLMFIQQVIHSVEWPEAPTYTVQIGSRTKDYPLDMEVVKQTEDPVEKAELRRKWVQYQQDLTDASMEMSKRSTGAVFFEGTEVDIDMAETDSKWARKMRIVGWKVPDDPEEKWIFYLQTSLSEDDIKNLSAAVIRRSGGVSEELINAAEEMFLDNLQAGPEEPGDLVDIEADS